MARGCNCGGAIAEFVHRARSQDGVSACGRQRLGYRQADASARADDQCRLAGKGEYLIEGFQRIDCIGPVKSDETPSEFRAWSIQVQSAGHADNSSGIRSRPTG